MATDWGAIAGAVVSLYNGNQAAKAAKHGGEQVAAGSAEATALQKAIYDDQRNLAMPGYNAGNWALGALTGALGGPSSWSNQGPQQAQQQQVQLSPIAAYLQANPDVANSKYFASRPLEHYNRFGKAEGRTWGVQPQAQQNGGMETGGNQPAQQAPQSQSQLYDMFRNGPGYQFGLQEGQRGIESSAAARGGLNSGATLKALQQHGTDYADQQGFRPWINTLQSVAGLQQTASNQIGQYGQNFGNQAGQNAMTAGLARGQSTYAAANARQQGYGQAAYLGGQAYDKWKGG